MTIIEGQTSDLFVAGYEKDGSWNRFATVARVLKN